MALIIEDYPNKYFLTREKPFKVSIQHEFKLKMNQENIKTVTHDQALKILKNTHSGANRLKTFLNYRIITIPTCMVGALGFYLGAGILLSALIATIIKVEIIASVAIIGLNMSILYDAYKHIRNLKCQFSQAPELVKALEDFNRKAQEYITQLEENPNLKVVIN